MEEPARPYFVQLKDLTYTLSGSVEQLDPDRVLALVLVIT